MPPFLARDNFGGKVDGITIEEHEWMVLFGFAGGMDIDIGVNIERDLFARLLGLI